MVKLVKLLKSEFIPGCLVSFRLLRSGAQRFPEVGVDRIVGLAFALGRRDPVEADRVAGLLVAEVLAFERIHRLFGFSVHGKVSEVGFAELGQLLVGFVGLLLTYVEDAVNVGVGDVRVLGVENVLGSVTDHVQHFVLALKTHQKALVT